MKTSTIIFLIAVLIFIRQVGGEILAHFNWSNNYEQLWSLADKSSTLPAKQKYINEFVSALENGYKKGDFATNNALWLKTPDNSFEANLEALRTLANRLEEIKGMDPSSFEYNTAIQQITAQEQGDASAMIKVFYGCFVLDSYTLNWGWISKFIYITSALTGLIIFAFKLSDL